MPTESDVRTRKPSRSQYDLVVLGSGPAGQKAAVPAAKLGKSVLLVEKNAVGGACLHTATIPSKTLKEAALDSFVGNPNILNEVMARKDQVIHREELVIEDQLARNHVEYVKGTGSFTSPHELEISNESGKFLVKAQVVVVAVGTHPCRPKGIEFDPEVIFDSDTILDLSHKPEKIAVVGAGVVGSEYASIFSRLGVRVTLIDQRERLLPFMDPDVIDALKSQFLASAIEVVLSAQFTDAKVVISSGKKKAQIKLNGKDRYFDALLYCIGRNGNTQDLNLQAAGLSANDRQLLTVNSNYQTEVPHIYAVGDVIGSPALASASAEQGRLAAMHAFSKVDGQFPDSFPYGIYTIPEISCVGAQEAELKEKKISYVVGVAKYKEIARGKILGDEHGFMKLIFDKSTRKLLGVHIIGSYATELIHIGQAAFILGGGLDFFLNNVFNYPTLAETYKVAALNAYNLLRAS